MAINKPDILESEFFLKKENVQSGKKYFLGNEFPLVAIGASAGGIDAVVDLFKNVPADCGISFVVSQDFTILSSSNNLFQLLKKYTHLSVIEVNQKTKININSIYVIPSNRIISISNKTLYLKSLNKKGHPDSSLSIDIFLRSLADNLKDKAMGILLSGLENDGLLGAKAIKDEDGLIIIQDPNTAAYNEILKAARDTGIADYVLPIHKIGEQLLNCIELFYRNTKEDNKEFKDYSKTIEQLFILIKDKTNLDFSNYKLNTINHRILRRMAVHQIQKVNDYLNFLRENSDEIEILVKDFLINETSFSRNPEAFAEFKKHIKYFIEDNKDKKEKQNFCVSESMFTQDFIKRVELQESSLSDIRQENYGNKAERHLLLAALEPSVLVNAELKVVCFHGNTSKFLAVPSKSSNMSVFELVNSQLKGSLVECLNEVIMQNQKLECENLYVSLDGKKQIIKISIAPISVSGNEAGNLFYSITFYELPYANKRFDFKETTFTQPVEFKNEQHFSNESLLQTIEKMETANENLRNANEEYQSANEELQSINEELIRVNNEYQEKIKDLCRANNDMVNILNSTGIAIIFLDHEMNLIRYTTKATELFNFIEADIGRPLNHITSQIQYADITQKVHSVIEKLEPVAQEIRTKQGILYCMSINPYSKAGSSSVGVVISFVNISENLKYAQAIIEPMPHPVFVLDENFFIIFANKKFYAFFQINSENIKNKFFFNIVEGRCNTAGFLKFLKSILNKKTATNRFKTEYSFLENNKKEIIFQVRSLPEVYGQENRILVEIMTTV